MQEFNKLVRDKIPGVIASKGQKANIRVLNDEEYRVALEKKLEEEVAEYLKDKNTEELADILEIHWLCDGLKRGAFQQNSSEYS